MFYRANPSLRWIKVGAILIILFLVVSSLLSCTEKILLHKSGLLAVDWPTKLDFCEEAVPLDDFYIREAWERDFLVILAQDYQNILYFKRAPKYLPFIEAELQKRDLPDDLKYLAIAESALREDITSSAGAAGIWQFIPETGQNYGLRIDAAIDERLHFEQATLAALSYLQFLHDKFGSWTLAAAAYNAGENGIERRLAEQGVASYYDLYLNEETSRYLFRIIAIKEIMQHSEKYGYEFSNKDYFQWPKSELLSVGAVENLSDWAVAHGSSLREIKELNPWIVGKSLPEGVWKVRVRR